MDFLWAGIWPCPHPLTWKSFLRHCCHAKIISIYVYLPKSSGYKTANTRRLVNAILTASWLRDDYNLNKPLGACSTPNTYDANVDKPPSPRQQAMQHNMPIQRVTQSPRVSHHTLITPRGSDAFDRTTKLRRPSLCRTIYTTYAKTVAEWRAWLMLQNLTSWTNLLTTYPVYD